MEYERFQSCTIALLRVKVFRGRSWVKRDASIFSRNWNEETHGRVESASGSWMNDCDDAACNHRAHNRAWLARNIATHWILCSCNFVLIDDEDKLRLDRAKRGEAVPFEFESDTRKIMDGREGSIRYFGRLSQKSYVYTTFPREDVKRKGKKERIGSRRRRGQRARRKTKRRGRRGGQNTGIANSYVDDCRA